jgi:hypothetical protein
MALINITARLEQRINNCDNGALALMLSDSIISLHHFHIFIKAADNVIITVDLILQLLKLDSHRIIKLK